MLGGVTRHMLPHLPGVSHLQVSRLLESKVLYFQTYNKGMINFTCHE